MSTRTNSKRTRQKFLQKSKKLRLENGRKRKALRRENLPEKNHLDLEILSSLRK